MLPGLDLNASDYFGIAAIIFALTAFFLIFNAMRQSKAASIVKREKPVETIVKNANPAPYVPYQPYVPSQNVEGVLIRVNVPTRIIAVNITFEDLIDLIVKKLQEQKQLIVQAKEEEAKEEREEREEEAKPTEEKELKELLIKGKVPKG